MFWQDSLKIGREAIFSTSSKSGEPNVEIIKSLGFVYDKVLFAITNANQTYRNILENPQICIISSNQGSYYRIKGDIEIFDSGKYFDVAKQRINFDVKLSILFSIKEIFDMEKSKVIRNK